MPVWNGSSSSNNTTVREYSAGIERNRLGAPLPPTPPPLPPHPRPPAQSSSAAAAADRRRPRDGDDETAAAADLSLMNRGVSSSHDSQLLLTLNLKSGQQQQLTTNSKKLTDLSTVIFRDSGEEGEASASATSISDISEVDMDGRRMVMAQEQDLPTAAAAAATTGYLLPRVFLKKEGTAKDRHQQPFKLHQNGETISNSVSNSGSERGADNKSSGYCSSNLYSSGSVEEPIYSEPLVADIVPRIVSDHVIDVVPHDDEEEEDDGHKTKPTICTTSKQQQQQQPAQKRVMGSTNSHNSHKVVITDESEHVEDDEGVGGRPRRSCMEEEEVEEEEEEEMSPPLSPSVAVGGLNDKSSSIIGKVPTQGKYSSPAAAAAAPTTTPTTTTTTITEVAVANENGLRRSSRKLPTIMEGIDGQIPRPIWPCDMDDSLMDINFDSFLYSNEKRESGQQQQQQQQRPRTRRCDSPTYERANNGDVAGGAQVVGDIENNYRCMKYLNSCSENPYLVEDVEDLQMSVDKSLALYLKKCDDSLTMQNTRDFLEDIRSKLNGLLEQHAQHSRVQRRATKMEAMVYEKSVALIERQVARLKCDLDSYLRLFNQSNEQQIKQLCTGLAKDARIQTLQNAIENRRNSMASSQHDPHPTSGSYGPVNQLLDPVVVIVDDGEDDDDDDNNNADRMSGNNYETMRDHHRHRQYPYQAAAAAPQNIFNVISQYPENDLSSYFDTVYVQDGFNMGYKVNHHHHHTNPTSTRGGGGGRVANNNNNTMMTFDGSVVLRGKSSTSRSPFVHSRKQASNSPSVLSVALDSRQKRSTPTTTTMTNDSNYNSIASSSDPNFRLKRNPSLSLSIASHTYSDRHPILASRDYERLSKPEHAAISIDGDSLNGSHGYPDTDSLESHRRDGQRVQNMLLTDQGRFNGTSAGNGVPASGAEEARKSIVSEDVGQEWHKNRPSIWELYYGINRPKQSMMSKKGAQPTVVKSGGKKKAAIPYPSTRPESDFTLDLHRAEHLQYKMKKDKQFRNRCRLITSFLSLVFFLLTVMVVSLVLTRGKRMFGSMI